MSNVADKLRKPAKKWPWFVGVPAVALLAGGTWLGASALAQPAPTPSPTLNAYVSPPLNADELASVQAGADQQAAIIKADQDAAAARAQAKAAALAAGHQIQVTPDGPIKCGPGYTANAVDADGNESNCQPTNANGQPCVEYNAQNQCTAYYKP